MQLIAYISVESRSLRSSHRDCSDAIGSDMKEVTDSVYSL